MTSPNCCCSIQNASSPVTGEIFLTCDCRPLIPVLGFRLVSPFTEFCRLVRSEQ